jgi:hypothetical protein
VVADGGGVQTVVMWQAGSCIVILRSIHIGVGICHLSFAVHTISIRDPPCKQLLAVVGAGAGFSFFCWWWSVLWCGFMHWWGFMVGSHTLLVVVVVGSFMVGPGGGLCMVVVGQAILLLRWR